MISYEAKHSRVELLPDRVRKTTCPDLMRIEVAKSRRAYELGKASGCFSVPRVLAHDEHTGVALFERLPLAGISGAVAWGPPRIRAARQLGRALAVIHRELRLPADLRHDLPTAFQFANHCDNVFLHGDLSVDNVCICVDRHELVLIDWQMTPLYGGQATFGTRYFDIAWFLSNLINRPFTRFIYSDPVTPVAEAFLGSYGEEARLAKFRQELYAYSVQFFAIEMPRIRRHIVSHSRGRALLLLPFVNRLYRQLMYLLKP